MHAGERLREERERLGFSQTDLAEVGGVTRKTQFNYESGERYPDAAYLGALASVGFDVLYVVTGHRCHIAMTVSQERAGYRVDALSPEETAVLENYRRSTPDMQEAARRVLAVVAPKAATSRASAQEFGPSAGRGSQPRIVGEESESSDRKKGKK